MQDAPDIDLRLPFDVEDQVGELPGPHEAQTGKVQLVRITWRADGWMFRDEAAGVAECVDKGEGKLSARLLHVVLDCSIDVASRLLAQNDTLAAHLLPAARTRPRSRSR